MTDYISTDIMCPGSVDGNNHTLFVISPETGNRFCFNKKCYCIYLGSDHVAYWEHGFDPLTAKSFIKNAIEERN